DMPLGVYPNLGRFVDPGWKRDERVGPREYAELALRWREEGAQIVGGCCGVGPEHIVAAGEALAVTRRGPREDGVGTLAEAPPALPELPRTAGLAQPWVDEHGRALYPVPLPKIVCDPGVFQPTQGSYLVWKHLFRS